MAYVGDMYAECHGAVLVLCQRYSVIEIFRIFGIDREDRFVTQIEPARHLGFCWLRWEAICFLHHIRRKFVWQIVLFRELCHLLLEVSYLADDGGNASFRICVI